MKKNTSKRYKKLLDSAKEKKVETIDEAIKKVKKWICRTWKSYSWFNQPKTSRKNCPGKNERFERT